MSKRIPLTYQKLDIKISQKKKTQCRKIKLLSSDPLYYLDFFHDSMNTYRCLIHQVLQHEQLHYILTENLHRQVAKNQTTPSEQANRKIQKSSNQQKALGQANNQEADK